MSFQASEHQGQWLLVMRPNRSADWQLLRVFMVASAGLTLGIALFWAMVGAWVILPFAGLEILLLVYFMLRVAKATHSQQTVHINHERVLVQMGLYYPREKWQLSTPRAVLRIERRSPTALPQVIVSDGINELELGGFLNPDDKAELLSWCKSQRLLKRREAKWTAQPM